jgi:hypothetical protein
MAGVVLPAVVVADVGCIEIPADVGGLVYIDIDVVVPPVAVAE